MILLERSHTGAVFLEMSRAGRKIHTFARRAWLMGLLAVTLLIGAAGAAYAWFYVDEAGHPRLVCLMYHRFVTDEEYRKCHGTERIYSMPLGRFEAELARLRERGYTAVTMDDAVAFARGERSLPQPAVLITIDDGCRSAVTRAVPLLRKYSLRATLFVTTDSHAYVFDRLEQARLSPAELRDVDSAVAK